MANIDELKINILNLGFTLGTIFFASALIYLLDPGPHNEDPDPKHWKLKKLQD